MRLWMLAMVIVLLSQRVIAQWQTIGNADTVTMSGSDIVVRSGPVVLKASFLSSDLVRIRLAQHGVLAPDVSWAVVRTDWKKTSVNVRETNDDIVATTDEISLVISKRPLRIRFVDRSGNIICEDDSSKGMSWNGNEIRTWKSMPFD